MEYFFYLNFFHFVIYTIRLKAMRLELTFFARFFFLLTKQQILAIMNINK